MKHAQDLQNALTYEEFDTNKTLLKLFNYYYSRVLF